jgi:hypothetical protein
MEQSNPIKEVMGPDMPTKVATPLLDHPDESKKSTIGWPGVFFDKAKRGIKMMTPRM